MFLGPVYKHVVFTLLTLCLGCPRSVLVQPSARIITVPFKNLVMVNLVTWVVMASKPFCLQSFVTACESVP